MVTARNMSATTVRACDAMRNLSTTRSIRLSRAPRVVPRSGGDNEFPAGASGFHGRMCLHDLREVVDLRDGHQRAAGGDGVQEVLQDLRGQVAGVATVGAQAHSAREVV